MRHILFLVYFVVAWQSILANVVPHPDDEEEKLLFYSLDSETAENNLSLKLNSLEKQVEELSNQLKHLSSQYDNLIERLSLVESEKTKERNQVPDKFNVELDQNDDDLPVEVENAMHFKTIGLKFYYIEENEKLDWSQAKDKCIQMNGHLVVLQNEEMWNALRVYLDPLESYWIEPFESYYSEPHNLATTLDDEFCIELGSELGLISCYEKKYFICEV